MSFHAALSVLPCFLRFHHDVMPSLSCRQQLLLIAAEALFRGLSLRHYFCRLLIFCAALCFFFSAAAVTRCFRFRPLFRGCSAAMLLMPRRPLIRL